MKPALRGLSVAFPWRAVGVSAQRASAKTLEFLIYLEAAASWTPRVKKDAGNPISLVSAERRRGTSRS